jgi:hypothetical protein
LIGEGGARAIRLGKERGMTRIFLAIVGLIYLALAIWCTLAPGKTSKAVGFDLRPGAGDSEFLTVYGGLEFALGLLLLWPLVRAEETAWPLFICLVVHACLVAFRTAGFVMFEGIPSFTIRLAVSEWIIFLISAWLYFSSRGQ